MAKNRNIIATLTENRIQLAITVASVALAIINFLIAYRLFPITQSVALNEVAIEVNAENIKRHEKDVCDRLDRIEDKVDELLIR